jgi:hypothetical protein
MNGFGYFSDQWFELNVRTFLYKFNWIEHDLGVGRCDSKMSTSTDKLYVSDRNMLSYILSNKAEDGSRPVYQTTLAKQRKEKNYLTVRLF